MYGFVVRPVSYNKPIRPIDALINYTDAHFIDWSLANLKFLDAFRRFYPDWETADEPISEILINDLQDAEERQSQPIPLLEKLVELTINTRGFEVFFDQ